MASLQGLTTATVVDVSDAFESLVYKCFFGVARMGCVPVMVQLVITANNGGMIGWGEGVAPSIIVQALLGLLRLLVVAARRPRLGLGFWDRSENGLSPRVALH